MTFVDATVVNVALPALQAIEPAQRAAVRRAIDQGFASAFRFVMLDAAALALAAAAAGAAIRCEDGRVGRGLT